jgi:Ca2+-binding EF-hand superfamily protein
MDLNHDGKISRSEWKGKEQAFDRIDVDHDGFITHDELKNARQHHRGRQNPQARPEKSELESPSQN